MPVTAPQKVAHTTDVLMEAAMVRALSELEPQTAIGIACSVLLLASYKNPEMLTRVLREPVIKEGFVGVSLLTVLNRHT